MTKQQKSIVAVFETGRAFTYAEIQTIIGKINCNLKCATATIQDDKFFTTKHRERTCELYVDLGSVEGVVTFEQIGGDAVRVLRSEWEA